MRLDAVGLDNVLPTNSFGINATKLSEATQQYLQLRGVGKAKTFHRAANRSLTAIIDVCGDKACSDYRTTDSGRVRDILLDIALNALSVRRM